MMVLQLIIGIYEFEKSELILKEEDSTVDKLMFTIFGVVIVNNFINYFVYQKIQV